MAVASGCGFKEVFSFLLLLYLLFFCSSIPTFCSFFINTKLTIIMNEIIVLNKN